ESDLPGPVSVYGTSKLAGEFLVQAACPRHFVIRTCGLYGEGDRHFVARMLRLAREGKPIRVVSDQICTPTRTSDLVETTLALLEASRFGLYHLTNSGACSRDEFTRAIFAEAGLNVPVESVTSAEFAAPARRPSYSVLDNSAYESLGLPRLPSWRQALAQF